MSDLTKAELRALYKKAVDYTRGGGSALCVWLYRNRNQSYFDDILANRSGIMKVNLKDDSGDPRSPINGRLNGTFFMASVEDGSTTGEPKLMSPFGSTRLLVPAQDLLGKAPNVYFADFYCMGRSPYHQVTLVLTRYRSVADNFCSARLVPVDLEDNPFLFYDTRGRLQVSEVSNLLVEVIFTEDLDIRSYTLKTNIPTFGRGFAKPGGVPKCSYCQECNLP